MAGGTRAARSLEHEYQLFIEQEIENYKESVPRSAILAIGDEAAARLATQQQFVLTELLLCEEVDRIIARRLRLPAYATWKKKRLKLHQELRRPEYWGLSADDAIVRSIGNPPARENRHAANRVLLAGEAAERSALFLAANGCEVTAIESTEESVQRVMEAAVQAGLAERVRAVAAELSEWIPSADAPLHAVVCSHSALEHLTQRDRARVIAVLQSATVDGGVHLVEMIVAGASALDELRATYVGWQVSVEPASGSGHVFLARKSTAAQSDLIVSH
jgi:hypothetical protein